MPSVSACRNDYVVVKPFRLLLSGLRDTPASSADVTLALATLGQQSSSCRSTLSSFRSLSPFEGARAFHTDNLESLIKHQFVDCGHDGVRW